jgi:hypothetical protein
MVTMWQTYHKDSHMTTRRHPPGPDKPTRRYAKSPTIKNLVAKKASAAAAQAAIKPVPPAIGSNAMGGLSNPFNQGPKARQSVDGRIGAELAAQTRADARYAHKAPAKPKSKPRSLSW